MKRYEDTLQSEVNRLNEKYCKNTKNHLVVDVGNGGKAVKIEGKKRSDGKGYRGVGKNGIQLTGHESQSETLKELWRRDSKGWLKNDIDNAEEYPKSRKRK